MANNRDFSDSIKLETIKYNLKKHNGSICCEVCSKKLNSIDKCHFDHIYPFAKGGKSTLDNCQILCEECNLKKNDKELQEFILEEKAKQFLSGAKLDNTNEETNLTTKEDNNSNDLNISNTEEEKSRSSKISKEEFDKIIQKFISKKGGIHKVDFTRAYNNLPSIWYVKEYYGNLNNLQKAFDVEELSLNWNREKIIKALRDFVSIHGDVVQTDLKKQNKLPSYPCVMRSFPEYSSFSTIKQQLLGIEDVYKVWTKEEVLEACKAFYEKNGYLNQKALKAKNNLPTCKVIYNHFGSLTNLQREIGAPINDGNLFVSKDKIEVAVNDYFGNSERVIESRKTFLEGFCYGIEVITKRYGSFDTFCSEFGIKVINKKKAVWTKKEIDDAIHNWIFNGNDIPLCKDLTSNGLPSISSIMKFYENWKEPFVLYKKIFDEANRNQTN